MSARKLSKDEAGRTLRTVTSEKAFYFYKGIGQPLGSVSKNLIEFAETVKEIDPSSVQFHLERGDFESWFRMLGDVSLAGQVASLRGKSMPAEELRARVSSTVGSRVGLLKKIAGSR